MAPLHNHKVLFLALLFFTSTFICTYSAAQVQPQKNELFGRRRFLEMEDEDEQPIIKKKSTTSSFSSAKNQTKLLKSITGSSKNQTKLIKAAISSGAAKNQTKLLKLPSDSAKNNTKLTKPASDLTEDKVIIKSLLKKLNSSSNSAEDEILIKSLLKKLSSTTKTPTSSAKNTTTLLKKSSDLLKTSTANNKTEKATISKEKTKSLSDKDPSSTSVEAKSKSPDKKPSSEQKLKSQKAETKQTLPSWVDQDDDDDLVSEFRTLPSKFQETLLPDLERISKSSKVYLTQANKKLTRGFNPIVGKKYAPTIAPIISFAFILIPLILVSLIFNRIKAYFSLQKILIFIQIYLSIYFSILCFSSLVSGLEPLRFFYATSRSTYICLQVLQTLAYVLYLLLLLMYLILVFSTETGMATKLLGLGQTIVGFAVGLHYYMTVFHRAVLHEPPKTSWRVHAMYATCFLVICLLTRADRRKKAYLEGSEEGNKTS